MQHTFFCNFFCRYFAQQQRETSRNFLITIFWSKCGTWSCSVFFRCRSFSPWWPPAFLIFSPPLRNFMLFLQQKWLPCFSYLALALFLVELRWTVALLSLFLCLSLYLFSKFLDINLNLIIWTTRIQKHFPLSVFVFIDSCCFCFTRHRWRHAFLPIKRDIWHRLTCSGCADGRRSNATSEPNLLSFTDYQFILAMELRHARFTRVGALLIRETLFVFWNVQL